MEAAIFANEAVCPAVPRPSAFILRFAQPSGLAKRCTKIFPDHYARNFCYSWADFHASDSIYSADCPTAWRKLKKRRQINEIGINWTSKKRI
jgi:hypothetical protein